MLIQYPGHSENWDSFEYNTKNNLIVYLYFNINTWITEYILSYAVTFRKNIIIDSPIWTLIYVACSIFKYQAVYLRKCQDPVKMRDPIPIIKVWDQFTRKKLGFNK